MSADFDSTFFFPFINSIFWGRLYSMPGPMVGDRDKETKKKHTNETEKACNLKELSV